MSNYNVELWVRDEASDDLRQVDFEVFQFPGGELQVKSLGDMPPISFLTLLYVRGADPYTIMTTQVLMEALYHTNETDLFVLAVPYLPAARSDRGDFATLPMYLGLLQSCALGHESNYLRFIDIHNKSAIPGEEGDDFTFQYGQIVDAMALSGFFDGHRYDGVIAPDAGAFERARDAADFLGVDLFTATKERDFETGKLTDFRAPEDLNPNGTYLIVDDICDGGGTFAGLAETIKKQYGGLRLTLDLWVTHGVFSGNWEANLTPHFRNVYTTNSHPNVDTINNPQVHVFDIRPFMIGQLT